MVRRTKPYNPAEKKKLDAPGQIGVPNLYYQNHSTDGFEYEQLAASDIAGGVIRSRRKQLLTPPRTQRALLELALQNLKAIGQFGGKNDEKEIISEKNIKIKKTRCDEMLSSAEHDAICWYVDMYTMIEDSGASISSYGQSTRSPSYKAKGPRPVHEASQRAAWAYVNDHLPEPHIEFLEWLAWHENELRSASMAPSATEMGKVFIRSNDGRRALGGAEGAMRAVAQNIAHHRAEHYIFDNRKKMAAKEAFENRKKVAYT